MPISQLLWVREERSSSAGRITCDQVTVINRHKSPGPNWSQLSPPHLSRVLLMWGRHQGAVQGGLKLLNIEMECEEI